MKKWADGTNNFDGLEMKVDRIDKRLDRLSDNIASWTTAEDFLKILFLTIIIILSSVGLVALLEKVVK